MPLRVTRQTLEVLGTSLGVVTPLGIGTLFPPFFKPNWRQSIALESAWRTNITQAKSSGAEERTQQYKRPVRTQTCLVTGMNQQESTQLQFSLMAMSGVGGTNRNKGVPFPIYPDRTELTTSANTGSSFLSCDTRYKRFYRGQRAALVPRNYSRFALTASPDVWITAEYVEIENVYSNGLDLTDPTIEDRVSGDHVYPMMDIHPNLSTKINPITDNHAELKLIVLEQDGASTLPPSWIGEIDEFVDYSLGYPIFALDTNWKSKIGFDILRQGSRFASGRGTITETEADRPTVRFSVSELDSTRQEAWNLLRFFDSRQGRTKPFWMIQPLTMWEPTSVTSPDKLDIPNYDYLQNLQDYITHVGIEYTDGSCEVVSVSSIVVQGTGYRITTSNFSSVLTIRRISPAWLSRFSSDALRQVWTTEGVSTTGVGIQQVLDESAVAITNL